LLGKKHAIKTGLVNYDFGIVTEIFDHRNNHQLITKRLYVFNKINNLSRHQSILSVAGKPLILFTNGSIKVWFQE